MRKKRRTEKSTAKELDAIGYRLMGRDPYKNNRWHVARWVGCNPGSGSGSFTIGWADTLQEAWELACDDKYGSELIQPTIYSDYAEDTAS